MKYFLWIALKKMCEKNLLVKKPHACERWAGEQINQQQRWQKRQNKGRTPMKWTGHLLSTSIFWQNIALVPELHFLVEVDPVRRCLLAQAPVCQAITSVCCGFHPLWDELLACLLHSFTCPPPECLALSSMSQSGRLSLSQACPVRGARAGNLPLTPRQYQPWP